MRSAILGGTFDVLHDGHRAMLTTAFQMAGHIRIGITTDERANAKRDRQVRSLRLRRQVLHNECQSLANVHGADYSVTEIESADDGIMTTDADYVIASPEQKVLDRIRDINDRRQSLGYHRLQIIEAPLVTDYKGRKISATRVRNGEIDTHGNRVDE